MILYINLALGNCVLQVYYLGYNYTLIYYSPGAGGGVLSFFVDSRIKA